MSLKSRRSLLLGLAGTASLTAGEKTLAAPELVGKPGDWINSDPLTLASRAGKVTIVHFWTFACYNCKNNLPVYQRWQQQFSPRDVVMIGIHTPELDRERDPANVRAKVKEFGIQYPVLLDNSYANWRRWNQQFWPCVYLIGRKGKIRARWDGELNYGGQRGEEKMAAGLERLLAESA